MKIESILIENFKGICEPKLIKFSDFSVVVGQNDAGKSTILKALDHFLNDTKPSIDDSNHMIEGDIMSITITLDPQNEEITIDSAVTTTFENEKIVNKNGLLEIRKSWDLSKSRIVADTFIKRVEFSEDDFLLCTEQQLIALCQKYQIETRKGNDENYNNIEKRKKLRAHLEGLGTEQSIKEDKLPTRGSGRLKEISDALNQSLPKFEYFKADTSLSESDTSIQKFFKKLSEKIIKEEIDTGEIEDKIGGIIEDVLEKVTKKINNVLGEDDAVEPEVKFDWTKLIQTSFKSTDADKNIPLSSRGDGFRRITMMAYFEYLAEQEANEKQNIIFGFEEPETFLHPSAQEKLFDKLSGLCKNGYNVIVSTHSPVLVARSKKSDLIHIGSNGVKYTVNQNLKDISSLASDLGITVDNQFLKLFEKTKIIFLVEGIDDAKVFHHISKVYKDAGEVDATFEELGVAIIPMGSCGSIKHWVSLNLLRELDKPYFIYVDSDKESLEQISANDTMLRGEGFTPEADYLVSRKRELENYIPHSYFVRERPDKGMVEYGDWDDVKEFAKMKVGGKHVARIHFPNLTYDDLKSTFHSEADDEFIQIYTTIRNKI